MKILYVTGNRSKYENAKKFFKPHAIEVEQVTLSLSEIQGDDSTEVALTKAQDAWKLVKQPLFINDASWFIPALKGFPGPYMKYINQWFEPIDFIHLMEGKIDRRIILKDIIVYIDENGPTIFTHEHVGILLNKVASEEYRHPSDAVISFSQNGVSLAEEMKSKSYFIEGEDKVWNDFVRWLQKEED